MQRPPRQSLWMARTYSLFTVMAHQDIAVRILPKDAGQKPGSIARETKTPRQHQLKYW